MTFQQLVDFKDESDALYDLLASLTDEEFQRNTQFKDWTIHDVIAHLHMFNWAAEESIRDGDSFTRFYQGLIQRRKDDGLSLIAATDLWLDETSAGIRRPVGWRSRSASPGRRKIRPRRAAELSVRTDATRQPRAPGVE